MLTKYLTFILYDSISNSIFISQVLKPILNLLQEDHNLEINLVSFEKKRPTNKTLKNLIPAHERLHFILCRRLPFLGKFTLNFAVFQLNKLFKIIDHKKIISRGPLAGWITQKTLNKLYTKTNKNNITLKIQARGLCAEEYRFATEDTKENFVFKKIRKSIYKKLKIVEYEAYKKDNNPHFKKKIESVSPALKEYLATNFYAAKSTISLATKDIPQNINEKEKTKWRKIIRTKLNIKDDQPAYCYSGSYKVWQCIPEIIEYFCQQYNKNSKSFLLLLSPNKKELKKLLLNKNIPKTNYALLNVKAEDLFKYMAAGDVGLLFRNKDIINWVSRPTKMLEYQAAGLKIIHNQTIAWLEN